MAITYALDIALHLERAMFYRARRNLRWHELHKHDARAKFWQIAIPSLLLFWGLAAYGVYRAV